MFPSSLTKMKQFLIVFLSLTATSPAIAKLAKTGCRDKCGNLTIPYPFGIGADCSINQWYAIDCKSSTPYLSALNNLEVLGVDLIFQTVSVSMPRISYCQIPVQTTIMDLGSSPFLFSRRNNKFFFEGCGVASLTDSGSVVTGCSTACLNVTQSDKNNCFGNGCCETAIPHHVKQYTINISGSEKEDGRCGSAFLTDQPSYDPFVSENTTFTPVSLLWSLTDSDQITCCFNRTPISGRVKAFNGNQLDTLICGYSSSLSVDDTPYLTDGCTLSETEKYAKTGCNDMCGNVRIPFPFGIGANCSINRWYTIDCNSSTPYLSALNHLEVLRVDLLNQTVTVGTPRITDCQNPVRNSIEIMGVDLDESPFLFSKLYNKFYFEGCGVAVMHMDNGSVLTGCSSSCRGGVTHDCFGIGCCETAIPHYLKSYNITLIGLEEEDGGCKGSAFLLDQTSYDQGRFSVTNTSLIPVSLMWTLTGSDEATCCYDEIPVISKVDVFLNGTTMETWQCNISNVGNITNPYLRDGCKNVYEVYIEECGRCREGGGYCRGHQTYDLDSLVFTQNFTCYQIGKTSSLGVILGVSLSMGLLLVVATSYVLYKWIKQTKERRQRKRFFKRNGGLLLKQQEETDPSLVGKTILFTSHELEKATDNFNENRILGQGGQGMVYKGMLVDGRIVAIKKSKAIDESQLEQFINEVVILSQVNHRNVVKLLGCCLETNVPLLVSEFIANGTLYDLLHTGIDKCPISLNMRLQVATEVAGALAYLHSATSIPIYHRDIKTTNILLDDKYRAKVSDFGTSRFVSVEQTHLTTLVKGTFGYLDPEYFQSSQFTEKSDVYSFGVVLAELLTGEKPISLTRFGEHRSLATHFMLAMEEGCVMSIFDSTVVKEGTRDKLLIAANLVIRCLNLNGRYRPTMREVATELETLRMSHIPSTTQTNIGPMIHQEDLSFITYNETSSTILSFNESIS